MRSKTILARNLREIMDRRPDIETPEKLARRAVWVAGPRKGDPVSARAIAYALDPSEDSSSPVMDLVDSLAAAVGVETWELITDRAVARRKILERLLRDQ